MLSRADNEFLCRVGPGTPTGEMFRRYWWPVLLSSELTERGRACTPRRITLFGETYVAFRGEDGVVGVLDERCPHRGASLVLGVVENCGIRCLYHGWKMAPDGAIQEAPNVADARTLEALKTRFKARAYPVREAGDLIWVYVGPADKQPPFPEYNWFEVPTRNRINSAVVLDANYLQTLENLVDPTHLGVLHQDPMRKMTVAVAQETSSSVMSDMAPLLEVEPANFGFRLAAIRRHGDCLRVRPVAYVAPACMLIPASPRSTAGGVLFFVPMSDVRTLQITIVWDEERAYNEEPIRSEVQQYFGISPKVIDDFGISREQCDRVGKPSASNNFLQNRASISSGESFTGIPDFVPEDAAVIGSQGAISDRSRDHLVPADIGVVHLRRLLMESARRVQEGGAPVGLDTVVDTSTICSHEYVVPVGTAWQTMLPHHPSAHVTKG